MKENLKGSGRYNYPKGISYIKADVDILSQKRFLLEVEMMSSKGSKNMLVILKNPSKAGLYDCKEADKTIYTVTKYFTHHLKQFSSYKKIIVVNLFPVYCTNSRELRLHIDKLLDEENCNTLETQIKQADKIIVAWGRHPVDCKCHFNMMKSFVLRLLKNKENVYEMGKKTNEHVFIPCKNPMHGQVWGYEKYQLIRFRV